MDLASHPDNPNRPPHWRWDRAVRLACGAAPSDRSLGDDAWVALGLQLAEALDAAGDEAAVGRVVRRWPAPFWAYRIWQARSVAGADGLVAHLVEAGLLAGGDDRDVAARAGLADPDQVRCYERLFFAVRDRLHLPGYIQRQVIGPALYLGLRPGDYTLFWKLMGYIGGPLVLDRVLYTLPRNRPTRPEAVAQFIAEELRSLVYGKGTAAAYSLYLGRDAALEMLGYALKLVEIDQDVDAHHESSSWADGVRLILDRAGVTVGRAAAAARLDGPAERRPGKPAVIDVPARFPEPRRAQEGDSP